MTHDATPPRRNPGLFRILCICSGPGKSVGDLCAAAQEPYYNSRVGSTLKWTIRDGEGKLFGYCHETLTKLEGDRHNTSIEYSYRFLGADGKSVIGRTPFIFSVSIENGVTKAFVYDVSKALKSGDYMPCGDLSSIPDVISAGQRLKDSEISIKLRSIFSGSNFYKDKRVLRRESVKVPAGEFDCFLVEDFETLTNSGPFRVQSWIARGVGIVKQIIYKKDGSVNQVFTLESVSR